MTVLVNVLTVWTVGVVIWGAIPATLFWLRLRNTTWRESDVGRALMTKARAVVVLYWSSLLVLALSFFLPVVFQLAVQAVANTYITVAVTRQWLVIRKAQQYPQPRPLLRDHRF